MRPVGFYIKSFYGMDCRTSIPPRFLQNDDDIQPWLTAELQYLRAGVIDRIEITFDRGAS